MKRLELIGQKFNHLAVIDFEGIRNGHATFGCLCDCGKGLILDGNKVMSGAQKSCGCSRIKKIHGHAKSGELKPASATYRAWCAMRNRCFNPNVRSYPNYGGRGITVCDRWLAFENFLEDMGPRPNNRSLDRENPWGNYEPGNCSWATLEEQSAHRRSNFLVEGELCLD